jgi:formimidoylglutamate deiminase
MPNLHSHAFQRAMAGRTGKPSPSRDDSFWTWRQSMYATVERLDADAFAYWIGAPRRRVVVRGGRIARDATRTE